MKRRVVVLNRSYQIANGNLCIQLFFYFSYQRLSRRFTRLDLSARKLPPALKVAIASCGSKNLFLLTKESQITAAATLIVFIMSPFFVSNLFFAGKPVIK